MAERNIGLIRTEIIRRFGLRGMDRVFGLLDIQQGLAQPSDARGRSMDKDLPYFLPGLSAAPWHVVDDEGINRLGRSYRRLLDEYRQVVHLRKGYFENRGEAAIPGWDSVKLREYWRDRPILRKLPKTSALLKGLPVAREALFSVLGPKTCIPQHSDEENFVLTVHIGLDVPEGCGLQVNGVARAHANGEVFLFDTSYMHEAWNDHPSAERVVLIVDIWHPEVTIRERMVIGLIRRWHDRSI